MDNVSEIRTPKPPRRRRVFVVPIVIISIIVIGSLLLALSGYWIDYLWFSELDQSGVFTTRLKWSIIVGLVVGLVTFAALLTSLTIARRVARHDFYAPFLNTPRRRKGLVDADLDVPPTRDQPVVSERALRPFALGFAAIGGLLAALAAGSQWVTVLAFVGRSSFHMNDPLYHHDLSFYVFTMPFFEFVSSTLSSIIVITTLATAALYLITGVIRYAPSFRIAGPAVTHLSVLGGLFLVLQAFNFRIYAWNLVHSPHGIAVGAGFTDVHARLPGSWVMIIASLSAAALIVVFAHRKQWRRLAAVPIAWLALAIITLGVVPSIVQAVLVTPNELKRENPVLANNIKLTQYAYGMTAVAERDFTDEASLTAKEFAANSATTSNIRLWSPPVLGQTLSQSQEFRTYYAFKDVDVDRYTFGPDEYRQVMLSTRELDVSLLTNPSWVSQRLKYTHGYGVVGSWPDRATVEGRPELFLRNIPPESVGQSTIKVTRPEIYYGEKADNYVIANSTESELDYPKGDNNVYTHYKGSGGIPINGFARRMALAYRFGDRQMLLSGAITPESRVMFRRNITARVHELAPFLKTDSDPYVVVRKNGSVVWIIDAYTTSDLLPYSDHSTLPTGGSINYLRNSVKAVVDAYSGKVTLYDVSNGDDPILTTWRRIFPNLFTSGKTMPKELVAHLRFPEDMFNVQTNKWLRYHMGEVAKDGTVSASSVQNFYQNEDEWAIPTLGADSGSSISGAATAGAAVNSFYILAKLPNGDAEEMLLVRPIVPRNKKNLIAYMGARMDPGHYGEIFNLKLSKQSLTQGPAQVSARIRQEPEIASQITLWSRGGTQPLFGDLLVLPIENSLLYVQPVYIESAEAQLPEFQRVVLVLGDTVAWGSSFDSALKSLLIKRGATGQTGGDATGAASDGTTGGSAATGGAAGSNGTAAGGTAGAKLTEAELNALVAEISTAYAKATECQRAGDWACYGEQTARIGTLLKQAQAQPAATSAK